MKYSNKDIYIRYATVNDIENIIHLVSTYFLDIEDINHENCIVALLKDKIIGFVYYCKGNFYELHTIAIHKNYKCKGIGTLLIKYMINNAIINKKIYLRTAIPNFFEKNGFIILDSYMKRELWKDCADCDRYYNCKQSVMCLGKYV